MNLIIITSVINISKDPLSYTKTRSVYSPSERFDQTIKTISSLDKIKNADIIFIESSDLDYEMENIIKSKVTFYENIKLEQVNSPYKASGESSQIYEALKKVDLSIYENFYKISGRYWLTEEFDSKHFDNKSNVFYDSKNNNEVVATVFYKIHKSYIDLYKKTLENCMVSKNMLEVEFKKHFQNKYEKIDNLGVVGHVSVDGAFWDGKTT